MLSDPKKRAEYDAGGHAGVAGYSAEDLFGGIDFEDLFRGVDFDFGSGQQVKVRQKGNVSMRQISVCPVCHGSGKMIEAVCPDPRYQRDGADLWREEILPLADAVLGTKLEVPILEGGKAEVEVPAGTQPDTVLRLRNKGLPRFGGDGKGDLYLQVKLRVPEKLSHEERELYERLRALAGKTKRHFWE